MMPLIHSIHPKKRKLDAWYHVYRESCVRKQVKLMVRAGFLGVRVRANPRAGNPRYSNAGMFVEY